MKKIGLQPIPMMDRDKKDEVPQGQVRPATELCFFLNPYSNSVKSQNKKFLVQVASSNTP